MWNNVEALEKLAKLIPYIFIILGFLVAVSGQFFTSKVERRIKVLKAAIELARKQTPPELDLQLGIDNAGDLVVVITSENEIPFKVRWTILTEKNIIVSPIMMSPLDVFPTPENKKWVYKQDIQLDKVTNNYIEISTVYESAYSSELNNPPDLRGEIRHKYKLVNGAPYPIN